MVPTHQNPIYGQFPSYHYIQAPYAAYGHNQIIHQLSQMPPQQPNPVVSNRGVMPINQPQTSMPNDVIPNQVVPHDNAISTIKVPPQTQPIQPAPQPINASHQQFQNRKSKRKGAIISDPVTNQEINIEDLAQKPIENPSNLSQSVQPTADTTATKPISSSIIQPDDQKIKPVESAAPVKSSTADDKQTTDNVPVTNVNVDKQEPQKEIKVINEPPQQQQPQQQQPQQQQPQQKPAINKSHSQTIEPVIKVDEPAVINKPVDSNKSEQFSIPVEVKRENVSPSHEQIAPGIAKI